MAACTKSERRLADMAFILHTVAEDRNGDAFIFAGMIGIQQWILSRGL